MPYPTVAQHTQPDPLVADLAARLRDAQQAYRVGIGEYGALTTAALPTRLLDALAVAIVPVIRQAATEATHRDALALRATP